MDSATKNSQNRAAARHRHLVVMGVAGCGKSSLGQAVAERLGWRLIEGDDYHAPESVRKMREGVALTDADRGGWLDRLGGLMAAESAGAVLTCSALRAAYRDRLRAAVPGLRFAFMAIEPAQAHERVAGRPGHIFPPSLVASQFQTLEDPGHEAGVLTLDATRPLDELTTRVTRWLAGDASEA